MPNTFDLREVGRRLETMREVLGINQGEFADSVDIDRSSYSKIENGKKPLKAEMAYVISERWNIPMDYFYRGRLTDLPQHLAAELRSRLTTRQR